MKNKFFIEFIFITSILFISSTVEGMNVSDISIGVEIGHQANYKVVTNEFRSVSDRSYFRYLLTFMNISDIPVSKDFTMTKIIEVINTTMSVYEGDVFGTTVTQLPTNTSNNGSLKYSYNNNSWTMNTGFLLGTPVVSTNWISWGELIDSFSSFNNDNHTVSASKSEDSHVFNSTLSMSFDYLPLNITYDGVEGLTFGMLTSYNKTSGILLYEEITFDIKTPIQSTLTQYFKIQLTTELPTVSHVEGTGLPGFDILSILPIFAVTVLYLYKKRET